MTDSAKPEEQPVDDVWKAAAYGNLDRTKDFIQTDPQLVNKPDATGYANFTRQIQPDADSAPQVKSSDSFVFQLPRDLPPFRSRTFKLPFHPPFTTRFLPLQWAALNNRVAVATFLIERGAAVNATDNDKQTPLHWACVRGSLPCAELLLRHGARLDQADCRGYDPIHVAAQYGHTGMIYHFKMRWNAEIDSHDSDGRSPLHWAAYKGFPDTVRLLLFADCHIARPDKEGCTPLHWAAIRGKSEAAHILAQAGGVALLEARDAEGSTPAQLATEKGHKSLGFFLANLQARLGKRSFWEEKGMAVVCLSLILGLVVMFVHLIVMAPGMTQMDVHAAGWSWIVVLTSGAGLYFMYTVSYCDPGFLDTGVKGHGNGIEPGSPVVSGKLCRNGYGRVSSNEASSKLNAALNHPELWSGNWGSMCTTCRIIKPWGAKHCGVTNRCVRRFDHYCPWMGNTIGKRNHRNFVVFLCLETVAMAAAFIVALQRLRQGGPTPSQWTYTGMVAFIVCDVAVLFPVLMLTGAQLSQVFRNITTNELSNAHRYQWLKDDNGRFNNPFDRGCQSNTVRFCQVVEDEEEIQRRVVMSVREMGEMLKEKGENMV